MRQRLLAEVERMRAKDPQLRDLSVCLALSKRRGPGTHEFIGKNHETLRKWLRQARVERKQRNEMLAAALLKEWPFGDRDGPGRSRAFVAGLSAAGLEADTEKNPSGNK
jgi:hypothetical protein